MYPVPVNNTKIKAHRRPPMPILFMNPSLPGAIVSMSCWKQKQRKWRSSDSASRCYRLEWYLTVSLDAILFRAHPSVPPGKEKSVVVMKVFMMNIVVTRSDDVSSHPGASVNLLSAVVDKGGYGEQDKNGKEHGIVDGYKHDGYGEEQELKQCLERVK